MGHLKRAVTFFGKIGALCPTHAAFDTLYGCSVLSSKMEQDFKISFEVKTFKNPLFFLDVLGTF